MRTKLLLGLFILWTPAVIAQHVQQAFALDQVRLLPSPFLDAQSTDQRYMLELNADRLLAPYLREAGLQPKASSYGNWENTGLDGHTAGHYLSALAQMYAATGEARFKSRLDYMISELSRCQDNRTDGYIGGIPGGPAMWSLVKKGDMSAFNKKWVPWYNLHKLFAGLRDAYLIAGNKQAKGVLVKLSDWAGSEVAGLTDNQMQTMLKTEFGGMNEVLADVTAITGDPKYLALARRFDHQAILQPLENYLDKLDGLHANTQIPKVIGFERISALDQDQKEDSAAQFFWETVVRNRTTAIGGNSVREHFNPKADFMPMLQSPEGPETCNSYNMLKLTKMLFLENPETKYIDYYERTLYNHILSSQRPGTGGFVYFTPIRPQHYRVYSQPQEGFWCCVGTGMENHGKYGELIYSHKGDDLYVNLFIPSVLNWKERGLTLTQQNHFPQEASSTLQIKLLKPRTFTLAIRQPAWLKGSMAVSVNGRPVTYVLQNGGYVGITRTWKSNDQISIDLPMESRLEYLPDHSEWAAITQGPFVLAAATGEDQQTGLNAGAERFGHIAGGPLMPMADAPLLVDDHKPVSQQLRPVPGKNLTYTLPGMIDQPLYKILTLVPFYQLQNTRYMLYWPVAEAGTATSRKLQLAKDDQTLELERRTVDRVSAGEQQPESDHALDFSESESGLLNNIHYREAKGYFSYQMRINPAVRVLHVTYYGKDQGRQFDLYLNEVKVAHVQLDGSRGDVFFSQDYEVNNILKDKAGKVTVKFIASPGSIVGKVSDIRLLK